MELTLVLPFKGTNVSLTETAHAETARTRGATLANGSRITLEISHEYKTRTRRMMKTKVEEPLVSGTILDPSIHTVINHDPKVVLNNTLYADLIDLHIAALTSLKNAILNGEH